MDKIIFYETAATSTSDASLRFTVWTQDTSDLGIHEIKFYVQLHDFIFNSLIREEKTFELKVVDLCEIAVIMLPIGVTSLP